MVNVRERRRTPVGAEREARKVFRETEAKEALSDYAKAQKAFHENRERLKAERLARETKSGSSPIGKPD
ncbi:transcription elongation GreA/GreB family factor [Bradyrhizobium sp. USDA 3364]